MECMALMQKGEKNRCVRQTSYNVKSSRSHSVFQLLIEEVFPSTQSFKVQVSSLREARSTCVTLQGPRR